MKRLALFVALVGVLVGVGQPQSAEATITFTYSGGFNIVNADHVGLEPAEFTFTAVFANTPYVDDGLGQPSLTATSTTFTISGASIPGSNGEYIADREFVMFPTLGGKAQPVKFIHELTGWSTGPRLVANLDNLFGGDGLGASIGDMPTVSHFPTSISEPTMIALPWNILYDVTNPSITTVYEPDPNPIPEPSSLIVWSLIGLSFGGIGWWRKRGAA